MDLSEQDQAYFKHSLHENGKFWSRFDKPDFRSMNAVVLEVGCGLGGLCVDAALSGARKVVGVDLNPHRTAFAMENARLHYPEITDKLDIRCMDIAELDSGETFDVIISKDAFEHIFGLENMLEEMAKRLKKGGRLYAGFGPLYNSCYGDHRRTRAVLPWLHLIVPERILLRWTNLHRRNKVGSIEELGLNRLSLGEFRKIFRNCSLEVVSFRVNCSSNPLSKLFTLIGRIPGLEEYFTHNIYCILEKR